LIVRKKMKTKVYELSRILKLKETELISILESLKIEVSTKFSSLSDEDVERVKTWCKQHQGSRMVEKREEFSRTNTESNLGMKKTDENGGIEIASICTEKKESRSMEYNPFAKEYNRQQRILNDKKNKLKTLTDKLKWYDTTDISSLHYSFEGKVCSKNTFQSQANIIEKETDVLQTNILETKQHIKTLFNPFNWFDGDQKNHRNRLQELEEKLNTKKEIMEQIQKSIAETDLSISKIENDIATYKNFDRNKVGNEINSLGSKIALLDEEFSQISNLKNKVDLELRPILQQVNNYEQEIAFSEEIIRKAQSVEKKLDCANSSYDRAMIHQECENHFNEGSPQKIIRQQERLIRTAQRDLEKARKRAHQIGNKALRDIRKIVIDGNNLCYEDDNFVGLAPVISAVIELRKKYKVVVVFDSAIRAQVNENDQIIRERFNDNDKVKVKVKVHIVATDKLADETILDIASRDDHCYIISNDRFGEYREKEVVKNNRIIRHEVVDGRVIIHDLNVNVRFD